MGLKLKQKSADLGDNNIFWTTMSDLMLGLAIIFMVLFVFAMTGFTQQNLEQKKQRMEMSKELIENLKKANIKAEVDKMTGDIKISDLDLFEVGSYTLSPKGKAFLDKFAPIYINTIFEKKDFVSNTESILVQGHTDSQSYAGISNPDEQYLRNMSLSLERANSVANYIFKTGYNKQYNEQLKKKLVVEGKSFSEPVLTDDGKEDYNKSRRVELRLKARSLDITDLMFQKANRNAK